MNSGRGGRSRPDPRRWQRRPSDRPREILDAAVGVFGERGFDCATVAEVARRAGVSPGTVMHYFGSKGELFEEVLTERFLEAVEGGEAMLAAHHGTARELLHSLIARMWTQLMRPGTVDLILFGLGKAQSFPDAVGGMCRELGPRWRRLLGAVLNAGIRSGEFRPLEVELQARILASGLAGLALAATHFAPFEKGAPAPARLLAQYLETIDAALTAVPAHTPGAPGGVLPFEGEGL
jgi:TetR/AcrR family transcriptional regulator